MRTKHSKEKQHQGELVQGGFWECQAGSGDSLVAEMGEAGTSGKVRGRASS